MLTVSDCEAVHMSISCSITKAMVDLNLFTIPGEADFNVINHPISSSVNGCTNWSSEINTGVHFAHFINGMDADAKT